MVAVRYYKIEGKDDSYVLFADTSHSLFCRTGKVNEIYELSPCWSVNHLVTKFQADEISAREINGLFGIKAEMLAVLESTDEVLTTRKIREQMDQEVSLNTIYGALKHLAWDGVIERHGPSGWSMNADTNCRPTLKDLRGIYSTIMN